MSLDLTKRGGPDRARIDMNETHQVKYWMGTFGVDEATLKQAIESAGSSVAAVREHLRRKRLAGVKQPAK